ncbi:hypothetical protein A2U01_0093844, partial [Trifolium medium]|nr:hypothetical protein [Trifolium medium]
MKIVGESDANGGGKAAVMFSGSWDRGRLAPSRMSRP